MTIFSKGENLYMAHCYRNRHPTNIMYPYWEIPEPVKNIISLLLQLLDDKSDDADPRLADEGLREMATSALHISLPSPPSPPSPPSWANSRQKTPTSSLVSLQNNRGTRRCMPRLKCCDHILSLYILYIYWLAHSYTIDLGYLHT